jgi:CheY-like chemotaxis protein
MIVDDQDYNINAINIILKYSLRLDPSVEVHKALNGHEALDLVIKDVKQNQYCSCSYSLILMDCNMPFMDGYQSTIKIRQYLYEMNID